MVQSYVGLLERRYAGRLDADAREFISFALDGAERMQRMIEDLLRYSRVGSRGGEFESTDLNEVLDEALTNLAASIEESGAEIDRGDLPTLDVDRSQMVQVFQNLVGNAIKFRADRPPRIQIRAAARNGSWMIAVKDNGVGVPEEQRERIFAIFQRLHSADTHPGTGIGLAICKKIIERHGRHLVNRQPARAQHSFSLPASDACRADRTRIAAPWRGCMMQDRALSILLVEDNAGDARLLREMIRDAGGANVDLHHVPDLAHAFQSLASEGFDIILLDLGLPDSRGLATFQTVHERHPELPVVVLSGLDDEEVAVTAVQEGARTTSSRSRYRGAHCSARSVTPLSATMRSNASSARSGAAGRVARSPSSAQKAASASPPPP